MKSFTSQFRRLEEVIFQLAELLSTKTTKLPAAAAEDLEASFQAILNRLIWLSSRYVKPHSREEVVIPGITFVGEAVNAFVSDLLESLRVSGHILEVTVNGRRRIRRNDRRLLHSMLQDIINELEGYLAQLRERRLDRDYHWVAEEVVSPYLANDIIPLQKSGVLVIANSPGLSFETSAPNIGPGESPADIAVDVYLDTDDDQAIDEVIGRVDSLTKVMGYTQIGDIEIQRGSIFRRSRAAADQVADELKSRLIKVERAFELAQLELRQADVDIREADAVNKLLSSLEGVPRACLRVGSILVIKYPHSGAFEPVVIVRNLSQLELHALDRFPEIQRHPETTLQALAMTLENMAMEQDQGADSDTGQS